MGSPFALYGGEFKLSKLNFLVINKYIFPIDFSIVHEQATANSRIELLWFSQIGILGSHW
jgi:hypothetical protein